MMRIFLSYGFNARDAWIPDVVGPLLESFGIRVETGSGASGTELTDHVKKAIDPCDAIIGFTTRREALASGGYTTHRWVQDELLYAADRGMRVLEVREDGVQGGGRLDAYPWLPLREEQRAECLRDVAVQIGKWRERVPYRLQLLPADFADAVRPHLIESSQLRCYCEWLEDEAAEEQSVRIKLVPKVGGVFARTPALPASALIRIRVECPAGTWVSSYENVDSLNVHLARG